MTSRKLPSREMVEGPSRAAARANDNVEAAVAEVPGMGPALATITDDCDRPLQGCRVRIAIGVDPFQLSSPFRAKKNPRSGLGAGVSGFPVLQNLRPLVRSPISGNKYERKQRNAHVDYRRRVIAGNQLRIELHCLLTPWQEPDLGSRSQRLMLHGNMRRKCKMTTSLLKTPLFFGASACFRTKIVSNKRSGV